MHQSAKLLDNILRTDPSRKMQVFCQELFFLKVINSEKRTTPRYFGFHTPTRPEVLREYGLSDETRSYYKIILNRYVFHSRRRKLRRSNNSFAQTRMAIFTFYMNS